MKAYSYLRVSSVGQIDGDGFARQREAIAKRCKMKKGILVREFIESGVSGTLDAEDRPAMTELLTVVRNPDNEVKVVIVERSDRLSRDLMVSEVLLAQFRAAGVTVLEAEDGRDLTLNDPDNPTATMVRQIMAVMSQFEKTSLVAKLRKARNRMKAETGRCEGRKPFGHHPEEQATLNRMMELRILPGRSVHRDRPKRSYAQIAAMLEEEGLKTRSGKPWSAQSIRKIVDRNEL